MANETYVTSDAWLSQVGRPDLIDEVADHFERPAASGTESFWSQDQNAQWPTAAQGWRSVGRMHPRAMERRAG
jgi:hypothetical protein